MLGNDNADQLGEAVNKFEVTERDQTLLKDNDAMDLYMKSLCQKYFTVV